MSALRSVGAATRLSILVSPRSGRSQVGPVEGDRLRIRVTAAAVDGAANEAVIRVLADVLGVPKSAVAIVAGRTSRRKTAATALPVDEVTRRLVGAGGTGELVGDGGLRTQEP